ARRRGRLAPLPNRERARDRRPHVLRRRSGEGRARPRGAPARLPPPGLRRPVIEGVVFDLDGLLLDSEQVWDTAREQLARERGGRWHDQAQRDMMGMSSPEWSRYMHDVIGLADPPEEISAEVIRRLERLYHARLPIIS